MFFFNPAYKGEGFAIHEYPDGTRVAKFFTYGEDGTQRWLIAVAGPGEPVLKVWETQGGAMGSTDNPQNVEEVRRGDLMLVPNGDKIRMTYEFGEEVISYDLQPLYRAGVIEPEPVPEPEPEPEPEPIPKVVQWDKQSPSGMWFEDAGGNPITHNPNELWGSSPVNVSDINPRAAVGVYRLVVLDGPITITRVGGSGPYNPQIEGLSPGTLSTGDERVVTLRLGPGAPPPLDNWVQASFIVDSSIGRLMTVSAQVAERG